MAGRSARSAAKQLPNSRVPATHNVAHQVLVRPPRTRVDPAKQADAWAAAAINDASWLEGELMLVPKGRAARRGCVGCNHRTSDAGVKRGGCTARLRGPQRRN